MILHFITQNSGTEQEAKDVYQGSNDRALRTSERRGFCSFMQNKNLYLLGLPPALAEKTG